ncbi:UDP-N-acetylmuramoyl-L-alanyl-D-glutamate--2,6-diaminopimelate ligase [Thermovibrio sp.]
MLLSRLLKPLSLQVDREVEVAGITEDSRQVKEGYLFFAYRGFSSDGNRFVEEALKRGACCVITDSEETFRRLRGKLPVFRVNQPRKALALLSARFYGNPERKLKVIGITGTNGKTTTALLTLGALNKLSIKAGYIGTLGYGISLSSLKPLGMTTPSPPLFFKILRKFVDRGCSYAVCEVSSHGLELDRVYGIEFEVGVFTNLTPEHLDFHKELYSYFLSKERLFFSTRFGLVNVDDRWGALLSGLRAAFPGELSTFGKGGDFKILSFKEGVLKLLWKGSTFTVYSSLKGEFNGYNLCGAFGALALCGIEPESLSEAFLGIKVPGRLEEVYPGVFVDYAHTPDALEKLLKTVSSFTKGRLITVFGCGGERDREKRAPMGRVARELSDLVIITSDNPRKEEPQRIIADILKGISSKEGVLVVPDRRRAIEKALSLKGKEDVVVIAGKGHEDYQIIGDRKIPFKDQQVVKEFYERRGDC